MASISSLQIGRECFLTAMGRTLVVEILGISGDSIWVSYPTTDVIKEGTGVELSFHEPGGFIGFHSRVTSEPKMNQSGIMLERAASARHNTQRKNWRVPTDFPVQLKAYGEDTLHEGVMKDLTIDGALIKTHSEFPAGSMVELTLQLPKSKPHTFLVQIVYTDPTTPEQQNRYGLRIVDAPNAAKNALTWFLYERIHEVYPQQLRDLYPRPPKRKPAAQQ